MSEPLGDVYWLLDRIESRRTFNAVVDALSDLKIANIDDASEIEIRESLEKYADPGVDMDVAVTAIQRVYSRLYDLEMNISAIMMTQRSNAPYIPMERVVK